MIVFNNWFFLIIFMKLIAMITPHNNSLNTQNNDTQNNDSSNNANQVNDMIIVINDDYQNLINMRIDAALASIIPEYSRTYITNLITHGNILVNSEPVKPKYKILGNETITIKNLNQQLIKQNKSNKSILDSLDESSDIEPLEDLDSINCINDVAEEHIEFTTLYADDDIIIINKPKNLTVHPGNGNLTGTLLNGLLFKYPELRLLPRAGIVHRLDKDTTGVMVVARNIIAQNKLVKQLQDRSIFRIYRAVVDGHPPKEGIINKNIARNTHKRTQMNVVDFGGKIAITKYRVLAYCLSNTQKLSYIECKLETGRTHQIRVHFKSINHPLIGDKTYGKHKINYAPNTQKCINNLNRQALHAYKLKLIHPTSNETIEFKAPMPYDIQELLNTIM